MDNKVKFEVLNQEQIQEIHAATLRVLERTGVKVYSAEAQKLLVDGGCRLGKDNLVKIPSFIVEQSLRTAAKGFILYDRLGKPAMAVEGRKSYFGTGVTNPNFRDWQSGTVNPTRVKDIENAALVSDYLTNIEWIMPLGSAQDVPAAVSDVYEFEAAVTNTTKPIVFICHDVKGLTDILEIAEAIAGGRENLEEKPFIVSYPEPTSPLVHTAEAVDKLLYSAKRGLPIVYTPCTMSGATAPVTMAGVLVQMNAECLSGLVMAQLKRPGVPVIMGGVLTIMDMATTTCSYGAPEMSILLAGCADIAHYYRLPTWGTAGCTDSKLPDEQAAIEATFSSFVNSLAGLNLIHDPGFLEGAMIGSLEMLLMTNEIAGMAKRFMKGIAVDRETLAEDVIDRVGPGGHFLGEKHTLDHFREEHWRPGLMDRRNYHTWMQDGGKSMGQRIKEKLKDILENHKPTPLPDKVRAKIRAIREKSEKQRVK